VVANLPAVYEALADRAADDPWLADVLVRGQARLRDCAHGDLPRWQAALEQLPSVGTRALLDRAAPELGAEVDDQAALKECLMILHPWRKGPLCLGGLRIDTEWRSDWKWQRLAPHVDLRGARILDIGCGNGYYGWRMLGAGADLVLGIDPTWVFVMQWLACRYFAGDLPNYVLPLAVEDLPEHGSRFDYLFSMGVLYHRREPVAHLRRLRRLLQAPATLVLESLVLPAGREGDLLLPQERYARMRNVWAVPGTERLLGWVKEAGFREGRLIDLSRTTNEEQRSTDWMRFESLQQALDPADPERTVEGLPAPVRAVVIARA